MLHSVLTDEKPKNHENYMIFSKSPIFGSEVRFRRSKVARSSKNRLFYSNSLKNRTDELHREKNLGVFFYLRCFFFTFSRGKKKTLKFLIFSKTAIDKKLKTVPF